jgi:MIP family channel proteins
LSAPLTKRLVAEVIGTFGFFFAGFCGIATLATQGAPAIQSLGIAFGFGLGLAMMIFAFGHVSGGHYNPAVTLGLGAARRFPTAEIAPYWGAQLVGGFLAALLIRVLFTSQISKLMLTHPGLGISNGKALVFEIVFTFLFVLVVATVATDERAPWNGVFAPLAIGLFIFTAATVVGPMSGGSFNPARSLDPAIVAGTFSDVWIYIVGPLVGGALGGLVHAYFRDSKAAAAAS